MTILELNTRTSVKYDVYTDKWRLTHDEKRNRYNLIYTQKLHNICIISLPQKVGPTATSKTLGISALQASVPVESRLFGISNWTTQLTAMQSGNNNLVSYPHLTEM